MDEASTKEEMLENLKVIQQCLLSLMIANCEKSTIKYGKSLKIIESRI